MSSRCNRSVTLRRRRRVLVSLGALGLMGLAPAARPQRKLPVLGVLTPHPPLPPTEAGEAAVLAKYKQLGWVNGETIHILRPNLEGREDRLDAAAEELVRQRADVIWAVGPEAALAAARATRTIPIVFWGVSAPIEQGLIDSFARPGRNLTGMAFTAGFESVKVLEALNQIAPQAKRIAHLVTPSAMRTVKGELLTAGRQPYLDAAKNLGLEVERFEVTRVEDFEAAFAGVLRWKAQALVVPGTTLTFRERRRVIEFANQNRLPCCSNMRPFVSAGALLSYGIDSLATLVHTLNYVDRILRGAKPGDLPVELPSKYELVVNQRTAKTLGLKIPQSILLLADRVIE